MSSKLKEEIEKMITMHMLAPELTRLVVQANLVESMVENLTERSGDDSASPLKDDFIEVIRSMAESARSIHGMVEIFEPEEKDGD